jgi:hypothetical protein
MMDMVGHLKLLQEDRLRKLIAAGGVSTAA